MDTVWIIWRSEQWYDDGFIGIYLSREKAETVCRTLGMSLAHIMEVKLDETDGEEGCK